MPRKNIYPLEGIPLFLWGVEAARKSGVIDKMIVTTEDDEIKDIAVKYGLEVLDRPAELATDEANMVSVVLHAIEYCESGGDCYDPIVVIKPCSPFLQPKSVRAAVKGAMKEGFDSATTVTQVPWTCHPANLRHTDEKGKLLFSFPDLREKYNRRQIASVYYKYCNLCVVRRDVVIITKTMYGSASYRVLCDPIECVDINEPEDVNYAEYLVSSGRVGWLGKKDHKRS